MGYCLKGLPRYQLPYRRLKKVQRMVQDADVHALASAGAGLHAFIDDLQLGLANVHDGINSVYFSMKPLESMALPSA
jgi:hypothetical protein